MLGSMSDMNNSVRIWQESRSNAIFYMVLEGAKTKTFRFAF